MKAQDVIKVYAFRIRDNEFEDISEGILSIETSSGVDFDEGIWQTPEVGQFRIVSRNANIDPSISSIVRYGSEIQIVRLKDGDEERVFTGYVTEVNVEYRPNDDPIITISGTDIIGLLNRTIITQEMIDEINTYHSLNPNDPYDCFTILNWLSNSWEENFAYQFNVKTRYQDLDVDLDYISPNIKFLSTSYPQVGESVWEFTSKLIASDLSFAYVTPDSTIFIAPHYKYDAVYHSLNDLNPGLSDDQILNREASLYLSSEPEFEFDLGEGESENGLGYKSIFVDDGFNRTVNEIKLTNTFYSVVDGEIVEGKDEREWTVANLFQSDSALEWGPAKLTIDTYYTALNPSVSRIGLVNRLAADIFVLSEIPEIQIAKVTIDGLKVSKNSTGSFVFAGAVQHKEFTCGDQIKIYHKVNNELSINKLCTVVGVKHEINESDIRTELILRKSEIQTVLEKQPVEPVITVTPTSGDTATSFTATLVNASSYLNNPEWELNGVPEGSELDRPTQTFAKEENPSLPIFRGPTQTWNYDDDGPLANFGEFGYGVGDWNVSVWVRGFNLFFRRKTFPTVISVDAAPVSSSFIVNTNQFGGFTFVDNSTRAEEWLWNFGDGTTSTLRNPPIKYYNAAGSYIVTLQVSDGITTVSSSQTVTAGERTAIPVRYVKATWDTVRNRANSTAPFDKHVTDRFWETELWSGFNQRLANSMFVAKEEIAGTFFLQDGTTVWDPMTNGDRVFNTNPAQNPTWRTITNQSRLDTGIWFKPLVTNNGNTETWKGSLILEATRNFSKNSPLALEDLNPTLNLVDALIIPSNYLLNRQYEPIDVSVSPDGVNWFPIGNWNFGPITSQPPAGSFWGGTLDNMPDTMPPIFPQT